MVVRSFLEDLHGGLGFSRRSAWWLRVFQRKCRVVRILHRFCMVVKDSPQDPHGG